MKPTLVLLHGAVLNRRMWDPVIADLSADFSIIALDLPGHGSRSNEPFRLDAAVALVHNATAACPPDSVYLVGDSLGSYVAQASAAGMQANLRGLVLAGGTADFHHGLAVWLYIVRGFVMTRLLPRSWVQRCMEHTMARLFPSGAAAVEAGLRPEAFNEVTAELRHFDALSALRAIEAPILFLNGSRDWVNCLGERKIRAALPRASFQLMPKLGHGVSMLDPAQFSARIRAFVK